jgi:hypothetical protein
VKPIVSVAAYFVSPWWDLREIQRHLELACSLQPQIALAQVAVRQELREEFTLSPSQGRELSQHKPIALRLTPICWQQPLQSSGNGGPITAANFQ